jgi:hypothetical protein
MSEELRIHVANHMSSVINPVRGTWWTPVADDCIQRLQRSKVRRSATGPRRQLMAVKFLLVQGVLRPG